MADDTPTPDTALVPVREQTVDFYGDALPAAQTADEQIWVPLRPICEALGIDWTAQRQRLLRDELLYPVKGVVVITTPGGPQAALALPIEMLPGWLSRIQVSRVKPALRERILRYQRECFRILWNAFKADILPTPVPPPADLSSARQALAWAETLTALARGQVELAERADDHDATIARMRGWAQQTNARLDALELALRTGTPVNEQQAADIGAAVSAVAHTLAQATGDSIGQAFAAVHGELHLRERVTSYKAVPAARYAAVLDWLYAWHRQLGGDPALLPPTQPPLFGAH